MADRKRPERLTVAQQRQRRLERQVKDLRASLQVAHQAVARANIRAEDAERRVDALGRDLDQKLMRLIREEWSKHLVELAKPFTP